MNPIKLADALEPFVNMASDPCPHCQGVLAKIRSLWQDDRYYGTRRLDTGQFVEGYVLRPDRNSAGHITHWHIDIVPEKEA